MIDRNEGEITSVKKHSKALGIASDQTDPNQGFLIYL
jgi:hypothetical protein